VEPGIKHHVNDIVAEQRYPEEEQARHNKENGHYLRVHFLRVIPFIDRKHERAPGQRERYHDQEREQGTETAGNGIDAQAFHVPEIFQKIPVGQADHKIRKIGDDERHPEGELFFYLVERKAERKVFGDHRNADRAPGKEGDQLAFENPGHAPVELHDKKDVERERDREYQDIHGHVLPCFLLRPQKAQRQLHHAVEKERGHGDHDPRRPGAGAEQG
jgi:hypothetical protein